VRGRAASAPLTSDSHRLRATYLWQPAVVPDRDPSPKWPPGRRRIVDWLLRDRGTGRIAVVQWPNPVLWVWVVTTVVAALGLYPSRADEIHWIGAGALIAWGADEILRGVNPVRRVLGLVVLGWQVYRLIG
jgi:hypothetical protein